MSTDNALLDQLAIRNLIARIAHRADEGTLDDYAVFYSENAVWEVVGGQKLVGLAEIVAAAKQRWEQKFTGPESNTRHCITTVDVSVTGNTAYAKSVYQFYVNVHKQPSLLAVGTYEDTFEKINGSWQVVMRKIQAPTQ